MKSRTNSFDVRKMTYLAIMTALVVVLQFAGGFIRFGMFSISLVLVPIIVGAAICGPLAGAWLGCVFGLMVFATGDAAAFLSIDPFGTVVTVMLKGILAGLASGLTFHLLRKFNKYVAVYAAAVVCPVVNTGIFILGSLVFFMDTIAEWAGTMSAVQYIFVALVGLNFFVELGINLLLAPAIVTLIKFVPEIRAARKAAK